MVFNDGDNDLMHLSAQRLYEAALALKGVEGQSNVARLLNISPQNMTAWEARGVSNQGALNAQAVLGCNANWLTTGDGEMVGTASATITATLPTLRAHATGTVPDLPSSYFVERIAFELDHLQQTSNVKVLGSLHQLCLLASSGLLADQDWDMVLQLANRLKK